MSAPDIANAAAMRAADDGAALELGLRPPVECALCELKHFALRVTDGTQARAAAGGTAATTAHNTSAVSALVAEPAAQPSNAADARPFVTTSAGRVASSNATESADDALATAAAAVALQSCTLADSLPHAATTPSAPRRNDELEAVAAALPGEPRNNTERNVTTSTSERQAVPADTTGVTVAEPAGDAPRPRAVQGPRAVWRQRLHTGRVHARTHTFVQTRLMPMDALGQHRVLLLTSKHTYLCTRERGKAAMPASSWCFDCLTQGKPQPKRQPIAKRCRRK